MNLPIDGSLRPGSTTSTIRSRPSRALARWQFARIEDRGTPIVVPVVDDPLERVEVPAARDRREEVAPDSLATSPEPVGFQVSSRPLDDLRGVEEDAFRLRARLQDRGEEAAVPAPDIDHVAEGREVVGPDHRRLDRPGQPGHRLVEDPGDLGVLGVVSPVGHPEVVVEGNLARPDAVKHVGPRLIMVHAQLGDRGRSERAGDAQTQSIAEGVWTNRPPSCSAKMPTLASPLSTR
jgi:hypothetical protein